MLTQGKRNTLDDTKERALFNFELLLHHWGIDYIKIGAHEYDFLSPSRQDKNYGACRFNVEKGKGADFAGTNYSEKDYARVGLGFSREDFAGFDEKVSNNWGFDVIGLCMRIHHCPSYTDAAVLLRRQLEEVEQNPTYRKPSRDAVIKRKQRLDSELLAKVKSAGLIWEKCLPLEGSLGETYLKSRKIFLRGPEPSIRFHPAILNGSAQRTFPTLLFRVMTAPNSILCAIHRIYLKDDGTGKADVENPKMALGSIKGAAIWFGDPDTRLHIVEGPENALSIRSMGANFVVSTINAANFSCLIIPPGVQEVILLPDNDEAGRLACVRATRWYQEQGKSVKVKFPPTIPGKKKTDWNDLLVA